MSKFETLKKEMASIEAAKNEIRGGVPASDFIAPNKKVLGEYIALCDRADVLQREYDVALMNQAESFGLMNCPATGWQILSATERANIESLVADRIANDAPMGGGDVFLADLD